MGFALAEMAAEMGAEVILIAGPVSLSTPYSKLITRIDVVTANEMYEATLNNYKKCDILIFAAAVADYTPQNAFSGKLKKEENNLQKIELIETIDILKSIGKNKLAHQIIIGFALESANLDNYAESKLISKNADFIIGNYANKENSGFGGDYNTISIYSRNTPVQHFQAMPKLDCAKIILEIVNL